MNTSPYPNNLTTVPATLDTLTPNVHWARKFRVPVTANSSRRIYDFELFYIVEGELEVYILDESYHLTAGSLIYLPAGVRHSKRSLSKRESLVIGIHFDFFDELRTKPPESFMFRNMIVDEKDVRASNFCCEPELENGRFLKSHLIKPKTQTVLLLESLVHEFTAQELGYQLVCRSLLLLIITHLIRNEAEMISNKSSKYNSQIQKLSQTLNSTYHEQWTVQRMAALVNLQEDYMGRLFKRMIGLSPIRYLQNIRHQEAKRLLRETDMTIDSVAEQVGYNDLHYFTRQFHKHEGMPPGHYRKISTTL